MINRFEATGIFASVALMALALFLLNMDTATKAISSNDGAESSASVVVSDGNAENAIRNSITSTGEISKLIIDDVVVGSGDAVKNGDTVSVHYIGTLKNGQQFDNSYLRGKPFDFTVGDGAVIKGWEEGLIGMKVGGQRILVIPADMAYGDKQVGPIPANSTLIFSIELIDIK